MNSLKLKTGKPKTIIYCGPDIPGGVLKKYSVYNNGLPKHLQKDIEQCPAITGLFVTPDRLSVTRARAEIPGTRENALYNQVLDYVRGDD